MTPIEAISKILDLQTEAIQDLQKRVKSLESSPANTSATEVQELELGPGLPVEVDQQKIVDGALVKKDAPANPEPVYNDGGNEKPEIESVNKDLDPIEVCKKCEIEPVEYPSSGCCKDCHVPLKRKKRSK